MFHVNTVHDLHLSYDCISTVCLSVLYQAGHINALLMVQNCSIFNIEKNVFSPFLNDILVRFQVSLLVPRTVLIMVIKLVFECRFIALT